jgi:hypothetical protein
MIFSFSLRSETSEKTAFFFFEAKNFSLHFRFVSLRTENERRTLDRIQNPNTAAQDKVFDAAPSPTILIL